VLRDKRNSGTDRGGKKAKGVQTSAVEGLPLEIFSSVSGLRKLGSREKKKISEQGHGQMLLELNSMINRDEKEELGWSEEN